VLLQLHDRRLVPLVGDAVVHELVGERDAGEPEQLAGVAAQRVGQLVHEAPRRLAVERADAVVLPPQPPEQPHGVRVGVGVGVVGQPAPLPPAAAAADILVLVGVGVLIIGSVGAGSGAEGVGVGVALGGKVRGVGERGEVEIIGEVGGLLVVGGEEDDDAVVARAEVVEVYRAMGVDDEGGSGVGQDGGAHQVPVRAPVDEDEAERRGGGGGSREGGEERPGGGGGSDGVDGEADGVGGEDVRQRPHRAERVGVGGRREDQDRRRGGGARRRRRRRAEARVEGVDA